MSEEVLSAISHSYELATYSTPELRGLFNDWLSEIEQEVLEFLENKTEVDPNEVAEHFRLELESVIFILSKLAQEGKINMQASGTGN
jgi:transcription initiation factor IIE alpha subunit